MDKKIILLFTLIFSLLLAVSVCAQDWPSFRKNFLNSGIQEITELSSAKPFAFKTNGLIWSTPVIDEKGVIYLGSGDKYFYAINPEGKLIWKYKINDVLDSLIDSAALITKSGKIIIPGGDGYLHALNKKDGKRIWIFKAYHASDDQEKTGVLVNSFEGNVVQGPNQLIYAGSDNGYLYCLNEEGEEIWNFKTDMMVWSAPVFDPENKWMSFGSLDSYLYLLNPETGELLDKTKLGEIKASPSYDPDQNLLFVGTSQGEMHAFKVSNQKLKKVWKFKVKKEIYSSAAYHQNKTYFGSADGKMYCLDYQGNLIWTYETDSSIAGSPVIIKDKMIIFGAANGKIYALDFNGTRLWSFQTTEEPHKANLDSSPAISQKGEIYIGSYNGNLYSLPIDYCLKNNDPQCEYGGNKDSLFEKEELLRFENWDGRLTNEIKVGLSEPIKIRLITFEDSQYVPNAAFSSFGLDLSIEPQADFFYRISGDGRFVDIIPKNFWEPETNYRIRIKGNYYTKKNFFIDLFKWFFLPKFEQELEFSTKELGSLDELGDFFISGLSLFQPLSINTLVAAGLDGQKYLASFSKVNSTKFELKLVPAFERNGRFFRIENTKREIILEGEFKGKYFSASGSPTLSAMGATIPLKRAVFSGSIEGEKIKNGMIFAETSCLKIKGNTNFYGFPLSLIEETCGRNLNLVIMARFEGLQE